MPGMEMHDCDAAGIFPAPQHSYERKTCHHIWSTLQFVHRIKMDVEAFYLENNC
jgi:hypothetical protein